MQVDVTRWMTWVVSPPESCHPRYSYCYEWNELANRDAGIDALALHGLLRALEA